MATTWDMYDTFEQRDQEIRGLKTLSDKKKKTLSDKKKKHCQTKKKKSTLRLEKILSNKKY